MAVLFYIILFVYIVLAINFALKRDVSMLRFFLWAVVFQNIICIVSYNFVPASMITLFSLVKEGMLYLCVALGIVNTLKVRAKSLYFRFAVIYCIIVFWNFYFTKADFHTSLVMFRFLILPILCLEAGRYLKISEDGVRKLLKIIAWIGIFLAVTGIFEYIIGDRFWTSIGYSQYAIDIKGSRDYKLINGVTANFYTWDFGSAIRRFVTYTADPLASGFLMSLSFAIICFRKSFLSSIRTKKQVYDLCFALMTIICVLTLSKAVFVNIAVLLIVKIYYSKNIPKVISRIAFFFLGAVIVVSFRGMIMDPNAGGSIIVHFNGFINGVKVSGIFGNGLGSAGASASMLAGADVEVAESFIGSMFVQLGMIGTFAFMGILWQIIKRINARFRETHDVFYAMCIGVFWGLVVSIFFSESSVSIMGTGIYFVLLGIASRDDSPIKNISAV